MGYKLKTVNTKDAPQAIGPYSQGKIVGNLVFTSGQIPLNIDGEIIKNNFELECKQVLTNLEAILLESGSCLENIIKLTVYLTDLNKFGILNDIFKEYFDKHLPARSTIEVSNLPMNARIEIEAIGLIND
tara:strand:+ start:399 stop:788 length:390 start_codon:yes stop_codon:yes gene_type:complete